MRAAAIRASSGWRRAVNSALGTFAVGEALMFSMFQARGATVSGLSIRRPSPSVADSTACGPASRSKAAKKRPSGPNETGVSPSRAETVPAGTWPRIQPPWVSSPW